MLTIKLSRIGKKKQPHYRFIVTEKARDPWAKAVEIIGFYNPRTNPSTLEVKRDRVEHWLSKGVQCTDTVWNLFIDQGIVKGEKRGTINLSNKRREKIEKEKTEKQAKEEEAKKKAAEAEAQAKAEAEAAAQAATEEKKEEAPAEEPKAEEAKTE